MNYQLNIFMGFVDIVIKNSDVESIDFDCSDSIADEYCLFVVESYNDVCNAIKEVSEFDSSFILATVTKSLADYIENSKIESKPEFPEFISAVSHYLSKLSEMYIPF